MGHGGPAAAGNRTRVSKERIPRVLPLDHCGFGLAASRVICLVNSCQSSGFDSREVSPGKNGRVWNESEKTIKLLRANANRYGRTMDAFMYFEHPVLTVRYHTLPKNFFFFFLK